MRKKKKEVKKHNANKSKKEYNISIKHLFFWFSKRKYPNQTKLDTLLSLYNNAQTKTCKNTKYYSTMIYNKWTINTFIITICPDKNKEIEFSVCLKSFLKVYNDNIKSHSVIIYATVK